MFPLVVFLQDTNVVPIKLEADDTFSPPAPSDAVSTTTPPPDAGTDTTPHADDTLQAAHSADTTSSLPTSPQSTSPGWASIAGKSDLVRRDSSGYGTVFRDTIFEVLECEENDLKALMGLMLLYSIMKNRQIKAVQQCNGLVCMQ